MVPRGGIALPNQWGTAPGLWLESPRGLIVMLPGVPLEMRKLMEHEVLPRLAAGAHGNAIVSAVLRTVGIPESTLAERIGTLEDELAPLTLAYLPSVAGVDLRLTAWTEPATRAEQLLRDAIARLRDVAGDWAYGEDTTDLAGVVIDRLRARGDTIAVAESCTGGMLGERITAVAGASDVFAGGVIAYDNRVKTGLLGVAEALIAEHGAVSGPVAAAMADGVVRVLGVQVAAAITGIAGPRGGSDEKPVGTVWFGFHVEGRTTVHQSVFGGTRTEIRERAAQGALAGLWKALGVRR
jgi:nicotinamide-nucleotide amidase